MPYDAGVASAVCFELNNNISGGRIEKIFQPAKEQIILQIYSKGERHNLCIDADANSPKVYITSQTAENPPSMSMFYSILRKYLMNGKINSVSLVGFDRIFEFKIDAFDEMGFQMPLYLYAECIRKQSNIILCRELPPSTSLTPPSQANGANNQPNASFVYEGGAAAAAEGAKKIIAALKTVDFSMSESRQILNGLVYILPSSGDKINPLEIYNPQQKPPSQKGVPSADGGGCIPHIISGSSTPVAHTSRHPLHGRGLDENFLVDLENAASESPDIPVCDWLLSKYQGLSPLITREIAFKASKSLKDTAISTGDVDKQTLKFYFNELIEKIKSNNFTPVMLSDENGGLIDFSYTDIRQYGSKIISKNFDSMSELVDFYFYKKEYDNRIRQKSQDILKVLTNSSSRLNKKIKLLEKELQECKSKEKFRIYGDLITSNIYRLEKGLEKYSLENYYDTVGDGVLDVPVIDIAVEKNLTPAQNAQKFYKKYNKLKSAEYHLSNQIELAQNDIVYVDSVFDSLTRALSERELSEIRDELKESGIMKSVKPGKTGKANLKSKKPQKQLSVSKPNEYKSTNGFKILCGKNNKQNDELTFRIASKNDLWFHAQKIPGSHVILVCENTGKTPSDIDIEEAAKIAAAYSKGKNMPLVPVDYAYARYVKKPGGAKPGFVTYMNFKTAIVKPSGEISGDK
ncbi:MAG: NFACT family protein [Oscillospiraceae bacterium]|nr:NFACT family protein [Oscillospiraceae bacterium]